MKSQKLFDSKVLERSMWMSLFHNYFNFIWENKSSKIWVKYQSLPKIILDKYYLFTNTILVILWAAADAVSLIFEEMGSPILNCTSSEEGDI